MAVFLTLGGLVVCLLAYLMADGKQKLSHREQVALLRYTHKADAYMQTLKMMDEIERYYNDHPNADDDEMRKAFPVLSNWRYMNVYSTRARTYRMAIAESRVIEQEKICREKYKSDLQLCDSKGSMWPCIGYDERVYRRYKSDDDATNKWVDEMRARYFVTGPCD